MLGFLIFVLSPLVISLVLSVTDYNVIGAQMHFVGIENFKHLFDGTDIYSRYLGQPFFRYMACLCLVVRFAFNRCSNVNVGRFAVARLKLAN